MKHLEIIRLRMSGKVPAKLIEDIRNSCSGEKQGCSVRIYYNASFLSDLAVHIHLETDSNGSVYSDLGLRLTAALREYGMIEHSVWIEDQAETFRGGP
jgi:hypothetical protein